MRRRNFVTGTIATAAALVLTSKPVVARPSASTFTDEDTLTERVDKLNALMGTKFEVDVTYPKEWETRRWCHVSKDELLGAQIPRLTWNVKHPWEWSVHLKQHGLQCTHDMNPLEFFHWTSQFAWEFRAKQARIVRL